MPPQWSAPPNGQNVPQGAAMPNTPRDPRSMGQRAGDIGWSTLVQPNLSLGQQQSALPQVSADYNPFQDRRQFGANARWRFEY